MSYSRREFLAKVGIGTSLLTVPTLSRGLILPEEKQLGVALVGLGNYATIQLAPGLEQAGNCKLAGIVTGTPEKAKKWKEKYNLPDRSIYSYETFDKIADNPDIDIVYVVLPNSMHHEYTIRAAKAGKHVFCEKPMAISVRQSEEMINACAKAGVRLFIGYRLHSEPFNMAAMNFRNNEDVGGIKYVQAEFGFRAGDPNQWRLKKSLAGGGAMMDVGIYCIQGARYSIGKEPIAVTAQEFKTDKVKFKEVDETIFWQMEFPDGVASNSVTSYAAYTERLYIAAERGWFELKPAYGYGPLKGATNKGPLDLPVVHHQAVQLEKFVECILEKKPSDSDGQEGLKDMKIIEAIYKSIQTGKRTLV